MAELASKYDAQPVQITGWRRQAKEGWRWNVAIPDAAFAGSAISSGWSDRLGTNTSGASVRNPDLMRRIDEQFLETPFYESRPRQRHLRHQDVEAGRGRMRRLMHKRGLMAVYQKLRTSQPHSGHKISPYLLRGLTIQQPDYVWCPYSNCDI